MNYAKIHREMEQVIADIRSKSITTADAKNIINAVDKVIKADLVHLVYARGVQPDQILLLEEDSQ